MMTIGSSAPLNPVALHEHGVEQSRGKDMPDFVLAPIVGPRDGTGAFALLRRRHAESRMKSPWLAWLAK